MEKNYPDKEEIAATARECGEFAKEYINGYRPPLNEKIVGDIPAGAKEIICRIREIGFYDETRKPEKITDSDTGKIIERDMTSLETQIFYSVGRVTTDVILEHTHNPEFTWFNLPPRHFHIVDQEEEKYLPVPKQIVMGNEREKIVFAIKLAHEMIHLKQKNVLEAAFEDFFDDDGVVGKRAVIKRCVAVGVDVTTKSGKRIFKNLNEAVTGELVKEAYWRFDDPFLVMAREETEAWRAKNVAQDDENDDIYFVRTDKNNLIQGEESIYRFSYQKEREILNILIDKIFANRDKLSEDDKKEFNLQSREDVFNIFVNATFAGDLRAVIKLIDHSFEKIGTTNEKVGTAQTLLSYENKIGNDEKPFNDIDGQLQFVKSL